MTANDQMPSFYASRPDVYVDGELTELGAGPLLSLFVEETTYGLFRCEVRLRNWGPIEQRVDFLHFGREPLDFGREFATELGAPGARRRVFAGRISALEAQFPNDRPPELVLLAEDRFQDLRMTRRTRTFEDASDEDVFRAIASDHSLTPEVDVQGETHPLLAQVAQTDLAFLRERASAVDAELWVEDGSLHVRSRASRDEGSVELAYGANLLEASLSADLAHQRSAVRVTGWGVAEKEAIEAEADEAAVQGELEGGASGGSVLADSFAARTEVVALAAATSQGEATKAAEARYRSRARRFVSGRVVVDGEASLRVGAHVELSRLGPLFDGRYYVSRVRHTFDLTHGFRSMAEVERSGLGGAA